MKWKVFFTFFLIFKDFLFVKYGQISDDKREISSNYYQQNIKD